MKTRALAGIILSLALLAACGEDAEPTADVTVEMSDWNGWDANHEPNVTTETFTVSEGDTFELEPAFGGPETVTVDSIETDSVTLSFDASLALVRDGGINMNMPIVATTVTEGETTELATPTFDGGMNYTITVQIKP